jgi:hypothetical protein
MELLLLPEPGDPAAAVPVREWFQTVIQLLVPRVQQTLEAAVVEVQTSGVPE